MPLGFRPRVIAGIVACGVLAACSSPAPPPPVPEPPPAAPTQPVGWRQVEFVDATAEEGERTLALNVFYPADSETEEKFTAPFYTGLDLSLDAPPAAGPHPVIVFSHGRGSNGLLYAWFAQALARSGYIVAALDHYRANTYDSSIVYLANRLWRRPLDVSRTLDFLLADPFWRTLIDPNRIGVAGHSQGGFTALWIGGARVNADEFLRFQQGWKDNRSVPEHLRAELPLDPAPALDVADGRVRAVFAMAPGMVQAFGMDPAGLRELRVPAYITVGESDTQTPPDENAEFAAQHIPDAELVVIPGAVDHEIFVNECTDIGRDELPEACIDAPGVDRAAIHRAVGDAAVRFFGENLTG